MESRDVPSDLGQVLERFYGDSQASGYQPGAYRL
jgi:hypothetical protein